MPPKPAPSPVENNPDLTLGVNVVGQSPHVFAYRFWTKAPNTNTWKVLKDGNTEDVIPDNFTVGPFPDGTMIAYWIGIAGKPSSVFRVSIVFAQDGAVGAGGMLTHEGKTSSAGGAVVENQVVLV